ncbi:hypothetical protein CAEBREN_30773 [Caenorhabditis brenneri]|uniref:Uncharacterized protein n=1 Tax=Caenorhabditis brenneri TaxID=135651 RepID=G0MGL5_CAEBE|nr:hypothetical protein CAEBREN_30773 [Caenorhabditis brenneri]
MDKNIIPPETDSQRMSMPLLTEGERTTVVALIDSYDKFKKNFKVTHLHPYVRWVCESFNICPWTDKPATTTTTTKATTTTKIKTTTTREPPITTTTYYVPEILGDPEMMDFEMPFEGPLVKRWGSGAQRSNLGAIKIWKSTKDDFLSKFIMQVPKDIVNLKILSQLYTLSSINVMGPNSGAPTIQKSSKDVSLQDPKLP